MVLKAMQGYAYPIKKGWCNVVLFLGGFEGFFLKDWFVLFLKKS